jgi:hypothetical protein
MLISGEGEVTNYSQKVKLNMRSLTWQTCSHTRDVVVAILYGCPKIWSGVHRDVSGQHEYTIVVVDEKRLIFEWKENKIHKDKGYVFLHQGQD